MNDADVRLEDLLDVARADAHEGAAGLRVRESSRLMRVEQRRAPLASARDLRLVPHALREPGDHHGHEEHHREGRRCAEVGHAEREVRRDEEEVEARARESTPPATDARKPKRIGDETIPRR